MPFVGSVLEHVPAERITIQHQLDIDEVLARLETGRQGLSEEETKRRFERFGPNELVTGERALPLVILLRQLRSPLIYILIAAGMVTALLGKYVDTAVILAVVVLNSVVGFVQEYKAEKAMRAPSGDHCTLSTSIGKSLFLIASPPFL